MFKITGFQHLRPCLVIRRIEVKFTTFAESQNLMSVCKKKNIFLNCNQRLYRMKVYRHIFIRERIIILIFLYTIYRQNNQLII